MARLLSGISAVRLALGALVFAAIGLPAIGVIAQVARSTEQAAETTGHPLSWGAILTTIQYSSIIALLATVLGLPGAWAMRRGSSVTTSLIGVPLLMPTYLAYAGWGLLRGPGSWLGDVLGRGPSWLSSAFDRGLSVAALSLWAWPVAALIVGASARRIPSHLLDALDLEPGPWWRRGVVVLGMLRGSIAAAFLVIALIMAGSAIPLHLAQVDTYTIHLWKYLSLTTNTASIWGASLPLLGVAVIGGGVLSRVAARERAPMRDEGDAASRRASRTALILALVVWSLSVLAPMALFVGHLRWWASLAGFWKSQGSAVGTSLGVGIAVGCVISFLAMGMWAVRSSCLRSGMARGALWMMLGAGLFPGVLVGSATLAFWNAPFMPRAAGDTLLPMVLAHVARFGFLGVLSGWWLASLETPDERGARLMLGGDGLRAWAGVCLRPSLGVIAGIGLAGMALSLHEIESTVIVQPPGPSSLAQHILDKLHYNRDEELCAACVNVLAIGTLLAGGSGWLIGLVARRHSQTPTDPRQA